MKTTITIRRAIAVAVLLLVFTNLAPAQDVRPIKVPFELLKTQHKVISVKINGKGPYRLIFDTGSPVNLLNTKVAAAAGVTGKEAAKNPFGALGGGAPVKIKTLEIGGVKAEDLPCVVMNHPTVEALSKAMGPCEGIIGYPFFARYKMTIDYQAKEMTFVPSAFVPSDALGGLQMLLLGGVKKKPPTPIAPAAQFGIRVQKDDKDEQAGVNVAEVFAGSPAAAAGLRVGDRLLTVDDRWTDSVTDCYHAAAGVRLGTPVRILIRRDKAEKEITLTVRAGV